MNKQTLQPAQTTERLCLLLKLGGVVTPLGFSQQVRNIPSQQAALMLTVSGNTVPLTDLQTGNIHY